MFDFHYYEEILVRSPEEAQKYLEQFPNDPFAKSELINLDIVFFHQQRVIDNYLELQKYYNYFIKQNHKLGIMRLGSNLTFYSFDLDDIANTRIYAQKVLKYLPEYLEIKILLASVNIRLGKEEIDSFNFLLSIYKEENIAREMKNVILSSIGEYYFKHKEYKKGRDFFEKCFLLNNDKLVLRRELLNMSLGELKDFDLLWEDYLKYKELIDEEETFLLCQNICEKLMDIENIKEAERYLKESEQFILDKKGEMVHLLNKIRLLGVSKLYKEALELIDSIKEETVINSPYFNFLKGTTIFLNEDRRLYDEGINCFKKLYQIMPSDENLQHIINAYSQMNKFELMHEYLDKFKNKKDPVYQYYQGLVLMGQGKYDQSEKCFLKYMSKTKRKVYEYVYVSKNNSPIKKAIIESFASDTCHAAYLHQASMEFHGFGKTNKSNPNKAKEIILNNIEKEKYVNETRSILGNIYLALNEEEKAFELFKEGHDSYLNFLDNSLSCTGFYCYCKALGIGTDKDENEAFEILESLTHEYMDDVCSYMYAYLCLVNNVHLEKAWNVLEQVNEWRYDTGKYFLMLKLAQKLGKKTNKLLRKYKESLKNVPVREKEHYLNNPEIFYLTNV